MNFFGMDLIRSRRGMISRIAHDLGITRGAVAKWDKVPAERLPDVERSTGIPRHVLRPDICPAASAAIPAPESPRAA